MNERKRQSDGYVDDMLRDGEVLRTSMMLADSVIMPARSRYTPPPRDTHDAPPLHYFARGYCFDQQTSDPRQVPWPSQSAGTYSTYNHTIGAICTCPDGTEGRLKPHPSSMSMLICEPLERDEPQDSASAYWRMKDSLNDAWKQYGPRRDGCGCHSRDQRIAEPGPPIPREWPKGGYGDPNVGGCSNWPDPFSLGPQPREGTECMDDAKRAGHIRNGRCVADRRDSAVINGGQSQAEGDPCGENGEGRLVRVNGELQCLPRQDLDQQAVRDRAYLASIAGIENEWRRYS
jgi:hypothetical protein